MAVRARGIAFIATFPVLFACGSQAPTADGGGAGSSNTHPSGGSAGTATAAGGSNSGTGGFGFAGRGEPGNGGTPSAGAAASSGGASATGGAGNTGEGHAGGAHTAAGAGGRAPGGGGFGGSAEMTRAGAAGMGMGGVGGSSVGASGGAGAAAGGAAGQTSDATIVPDPSWTCGMPDGIPSPARGTLAFHLSLQLGSTHDVGTTQFGHRRILDVKGGTLTGDNIQATVLSGGLDLELTLSTGAVELEQLDVLRASDGTLIFMRNCGVAPADGSAVRVAFDFEVATTKSAAWLASGHYVGTRLVDATAGTIELDGYDISKATTSDSKIELQDPAGVPNVAWDCSSKSGGKGSSVFTENVTLGSSLSVGTTKRGNRNIVPITGGTTTGKVAGAILSGGADYQLSGLDARYTLAPSDGELILVRNCGPVGALAPIFEARADGPYAFLNANTFVSSDPGSGNGGVSITFYERQ